MIDPLADLPPRPDPDPNPGPLDLPALDSWIHERDHGPGCWACNPPLGQPMSDQLKALRFLRRASTELRELRARRLEVADYSAAGLRQTQRLMLLEETLTRLREAARAVCDENNNQAEHDAAIDALAAELPPEEGK